MLFRSVFYLPEEQRGLAGVVHLAQSIHNYFEYRRQSTTRDLRFRLSEGRTSLLIGIGFLVVCLFLREALRRWAGDATLGAALAEGLLIAGWVAMWRPINIFLYEWWPMRRLARVYAKIAAMEVEVRPPPSSRGTERPAE